jgi:predicted membrane protein
LLLIFILVFVRPFQPSAAARDASGRQEIVAVMGGDQRRSSGEPFRGAKMTAVMGGAELDLREATVTQGEPVVVEVFALMGGTVLRVPPEWTVDLRVTPLMGGVNDERRKRAAASFDEQPGSTPKSAPHLIVRGSVMMGGVVIKN